MAATKTNLFFILCIAFATLTLLVIADDDDSHSYLDIETPTTFNYNSPLRQPDSLRSRPYYDFLSTLYRHDATKSSLFQPYQRVRRDAKADEALSPVASVAATATS